MFYLTKIEVMSLKFALLSVIGTNDSSWCACTRRSYNLGKNRFRSYGLVAFRSEIKFPTLESHLFPFGLIEVVVK